MYYIFNDTIVYKDKALEEVKKDGMMLRKVSKPLQDDYDVVMEALKNNIYSISFVGDKLKNNKEIGLFVVKSDPSLFTALGDNLLFDDDIVSCVATVYNKEDALIKLNHHNDPYYDRLNDMFPFFSKELRSDKEIVLLAVSLEQDALRYASPNLRADKEVVLTAIIKNAYALKYADLLLKKDVDCAIAALIKNEYALEYIDKSIREYCLQKVEELNKNKKVGKK